MRSDPSKGLEAHVDADFDGNYDHFDTANPDWVMSKPKFFQIVFALLFICKTLHSRCPRSSSCNTRIEIANFHRRKLICDQ